MCVGLPSFIINDRYIIKSDAWTADAAAIQGRIYIHRRFFICQFAFGVGSYGEGRGEREKKRNLCASFEVVKCMSLMGRVYARKAENRHIDTHAMMMMMAE